MFIHWGPYSLASVEASWPIMRPKPGGITEKEYSSLWRRFNPTSFDPNAWIDLTRTAGQEYMVFTTRHHDEFCMFDSSYTDYTNTPYGKDTVKQLSDACDAREMRLGFYYSPPDMHHADFRDTSKPVSENWNGQQLRCHVQGNPDRSSILGACGIVRNAHLPAYEKAGLQVIALMDQDPEKAAVLAAERRISHTFRSLAEIVRFAPHNVVFDVAVPASQLMRILPQLPDGAAVLMQKPMGETLDNSRAIRDLCRRKGFLASVNFSLRYSPNNLAVIALAQAGLLGDIHDLQIQTTTYTPWHLWTFLTTATRLEILYHSIHYFDLIRSWLGNPESVYARTLKNPHSAKLPILDYEDSSRVFVATNHHHNFGPKHQHSFVQWEGTRGAARISMGVNLDYPRGKHQASQSRHRCRLPQSILDQQFDTRQIDADRILSSNCATARSMTASDRCSGFPNLCRCPWGIPQPHASRGGTARRGRRTRRCGAERRRSGRSCRGDANALHWLMPALAAMLELLIAE